ncbi:MAG: hypothetical protein J6U21_05830, partial [Bacteroidales bacterium]|nr:hypothetical protein [Bacteroidales bacterium]
MREIHPNAKINIGLNITNRRPDGFHDIETVFYPVRLADHLFIRPAENKDEEIFNVWSSIRTVGGVRDESIQEELSKGGTNIISKALALLRENYTVPPIDLAMLKNIPVGAGLGGGSSDAAFFIK